MTSRPTAPPRTPPMTLCLVTIAIACAAGGCGFTQRPDFDQEAIRGPIQVRDPLMAEEDGSFGLLESGMWAFATPRGSDGRAGPGWQTGQIVRLRDATEEAAPTVHLMVVIDTHEWGVRLQRLDTAEPTRAQHVALTPVSSLADADADMLGVETCLGTGDPVRSECLRAAPPGTRFALYALSDDDRLTVRDELERPGMPVRRAALLWRRGADALQRYQVVGDGADELPERWLAAPLPGSVQAPTRARVGVAGDARCAKIADAASSDAPGVEVVSLPPAELEGLRHPLAVEAVAYRHGLDAMLRCSGTTITMLVPSLMRARLSLPWTPNDTDLLFAGLEPVEIRADEAATPTDIARLAGLLGVGDWEAAEFALARIFTRTPHRRRHAALARATMQVIALAGRPEAALHEGSLATATSWNRDLMAGWRVGLSAVHLALGQRSRHIEVEGQLSEIARQQRDDHFEAWLRWRTLERRRARIDRAQFEAAVGSLEGPDREMWVLAMHLLRLDWSGRDPLDRPELREAFRARGLEDLWRGLDGESVALSCPPDGPCTLDGYGRRLTARLTAFVEGAIEASTLLDEFSRMRPALFAPGLSADPIDADAIYEVSEAGDRALFVALLRLPHLDRDRRLGAMEAVARALAARLADPERAAGLCGASPSLPWRPLGRLSDSRDPRDAAPTPTAARPAWTLDAGLPAACRGLDAFESAVEDLLAQPDGEATLGANLPLVEALLERSRDDDAAALSVLELGARAASTAGDTPMCVRWNLALATLWIESGALDRAERALQRSMDCREHGTTRSDELVTLLSSVLTYERSGHLPYQMTDTALRRRLERALGLRYGPDAPACVGLETIGYELRSLLGDDLRELLAGIAPPRRDATAAAGPVLELAIASEQLAFARRRLDSATEALREGRPSRTASALLDARVAFRRYGNLPGRRRVELLSEVAFGGATERFAGEDASPETSAKDTTGEGGAADAEAPAADTPDPASNESTGGSATSKEAAPWAPAIREGRLEEAERLARERIEARRSKDDSATGPDALEALVAIALIRGDLSEARRLVAGEEYLRGSAPFCGDAPARDDR